MSLRVLIIDDHDDLATALAGEFITWGHFVRTTENRKEAIDLARAEDFDLVITDLDGESLGTQTGANGHEDLPCLPKPLKHRRSNVKAFKICLAQFRSDEFSEDELVRLVRTTLNYKAKFIDRGPEIKDRHEKIEFEVPSVIALMDDILEYLLKRVQKLGVVCPEQSNLFVALDEAFVNAIKHGNKFDAGKLVTIAVDISPNEAKFTIEDEGEGFNVSEIPDPRNPENLFKTSGRGVMFIYNIMDEVIYNERGNRLTMIKKSERPKG